MSYFVEKFFIVDFMMGGVSAVSFPRFIHVQFAEHLL